MTRPLRVLYVLNAAGGGATQGILELLSSLPRDAYQAYLALPGQPNAYQQAQFSELAEEWHTIPMVWWNQKDRLPSHWRLLLWGREMSRSLFHLRPVRQLVKLIQSRQIDIVYTGTSLTVEGALAARRCGVPHLWHIKEWIGSRARVRFMLPDRRLVRMMAALSDRVLVMSRFIGEIFVHNGLDYGDKLILVRDGVNVVQFAGQADGTSLRRQLGIGEDALVVAMATSLSSTWKQQDVFIRMAARLSDDFPEVRFVAFGSLPKARENPIYNHGRLHYQRLEQLVGELRLQDRFVWAGFVKDIPQMMDAADILVHPCAIEPFGRVAIEAMAAGRPVVGPAQGGIAESVVHARTGFLVEVGNPASFAEAAGRLIRDKTLRERMGAEARRHVAEHFSLAQHAGHIKSIFASVCAETASSMPLATWGEDNAH